MNNSFITIKDLRCLCPPRRRRAGISCVGNEFSVDLRLAYDASAAMRSDDVADALNYAEVVEEVKAVMDTYHQSSSNM